MIEKILDIIKAIRDWSKSRFVDKSGDTMTGALYNFSGYTNRKTKIFGNGIRNLIPSDQNSSGGFGYASIDDEDSLFAISGYFHNSLNPEEDYFYMGEGYTQYSKQLRLKEIWAGTQNAHKGISRINGTDFFRSYTYKPNNNGNRALYLMFDVTHIYTAADSATNLPGVLFEGTVLTKRNNSTAAGTFGNIADREPMWIKMGASYRKSTTVNNTTLVLKTSSMNMKPVLVKDTNDNKYYLGLIVIEYDGCLLAFNGVLHGDVVDKWIAMPSASMPTNIEMINDNAEILTYPVANKAINDNEGNPFLSSYIRKVFSASAEKDIYIKFDTDADLGKRIIYLVIVNIPRNKGTALNNNAIFLYTINKYINTSVSYYTSLDCIYENPEISGKYTVISQGINDGSGGDFFSLRAKHDMENSIMKLDVYMLP